VAHWAKVIGSPRLNKFTGEKEWSIDVTPDKEGLATLKKLGIADRLREPKEGDTRTERFLSFRHNELKKDGTRAEPLRVVDANNNAWDNRLIGNGSKVDVKFVVKDYGVGKKKGVYIRALRVLELVPYVSQDFAPLDTDDEFFAEDPVAEETTTATMPTVQDALDALDDDVPM
jgi:hypothetical protein